MVERRQHDRLGGSRTDRRRPLAQRQASRLTWRRNFKLVIPALMLSVLNHYESSSMRVIGTLGGLYPKKDNSWEYHMNRYSLLNPTQKAAIARFLAALPK